MTEADKKAESALIDLEEWYRSRAATKGHTRGAILAVLEAFLGVHEIGTSNKGYWVDRFHKSCGLRPGYPWCLMFLQYSYKLVSDWGEMKDLIPNNTAGTQKLAQWAEDNGLIRRHLSEASTGDLIIWRNGKKSTGHVGSIISNVTEGQLYTLKTIEGNTSSSDYRDGGMIAQKQYEYAQGELGVPLRNRWLRCIISFDDLFALATEVEK